MLYSLLVIAGYLLYRLPRVLVKDKAVIGTFLFWSLIITDVNLRNRSATDDSIDLQVIIKIFIALLMLLIAVLHLKDFFKNLTNPPLLYVFVFSGICMLSTFYSPNASYTFAISIIYLSMCVSSAFIATIFDFKDYIKIGLKSLLTFVVLSWVAYFVVPDLAIIQNSFEYSNINRMAGISSHPNGLGIISLLLLIHNIYFQNAFGHSRNNKIIQIVIYGLALTTIFFTGSRTSLALALLVVMYLFYQQKPYLFYLSLISGAIILFASISNFNSILTLLTRDSDISDLESAAGRTKIWEFALDNIASQPFFGYGYGSGKYMINTSVDSEVETSHAHNMVLQSLLSVGIIGTFFLLILLLRQFKMLLVKPFAFRDIILVCITLLGIFESSIVNPTMLSYIWILSMAIKPDNIIYVREPSKEVEEVLIEK